MIKEYLIGRVLICKLEKGDDLLESIVEICKKKGIQVAAIHAIGALSEVKVAYYNQEEFKYEEFKLEGRFEILNLAGNISLKDKEPICHAHLTVGSRDGKAFGGHLLKGCKVFACELFIYELIGPPLNRGFDETTKLPLWQ